MTKICRSASPLFSLVCKSSSDHIWKKLTVKRFQGVIEISSLDTQGEHLSFEPQTVQYLRPLESLSASQDHCMASILPFTLISLCFSFYNYSYITYFCGTKAWKIQFTCADWGKIHYEESHNRYEKIATCCSTWEIKLFEAANSRLFLFI